MCITYAAVRELRDALELEIEERVLDGLSTIGALDINGLLSENRGVNTLCALGILSPVPVGNAEGVGSGLVTGSGISLELTCDELNMSIDCLLEES